VIALLLQVATEPHHGYTYTLFQMGALGLLFVGALDSVPIPMFAGSDILIALLAAGHGNLWYQFAAMATAGSLVGAYVTFSLARRAGLAYLHSKLGKGRQPTVLRLFEKWGTGALVVSTIVPQMPATVFFAAAGASDYPLRKYLAVVALCRAVRYSLIALLAGRYGGDFIRVIRHPGRYWGWLLLLTAILIFAVGAGVWIYRKFETAVA